MRYATCPDIQWRYEQAPYATKCLLLVKGGTAVIGLPRDGYGTEYFAWCPLPKRDRDAENRLGIHDLI